MFLPFVFQSGHMAKSTLHIIAGVKSAYQMSAACWLIAKPELLE